MEQSFDFTLEESGVVMRATLRDDEGRACVLVVHTGWQTAAKWRALDALKWQPSDQHTFCRPKVWMLEFHAPAFAQLGSFGSVAKHTGSDEICCASGRSPCYIRVEHEGVQELFSLLVNAGSARFWEALTSLHRQHFRT